MLGTLERDSGHGGVTTKKNDVSTMSPEKKAGPGDPELIKNHLPGILDEDAAAGVGGDGRKEERRSSPRGKRKRSLSSRGQGWLD